MVFSDSRTNTTEAITEPPEVSPANTSLESHLSSVLSISSSILLVLSIPAMQESNTTTCRDCNFLKIFSRKEEMKLCYLQILSTFVHLLGTIRPNIIPSTIRSGLRSLDQVLALMGMGGSRKRKPIRAYILNLPRFGFNSKYPQDKSSKLSI